MPRSPIDKAKAHEIVWPNVSPIFEVTRPMEGACFVYVIGEADDGPLKIGLSKDPTARLRTMQTGNPRRLRIEYVLMGDMAIEKLLHELWEPFAIVSANSAGKVGAAPGTERFKPEARDQLLDIIHDAVDRQVEYLEDAVFAALNGRSEEGPSYAELEYRVRQAHADSGMVAKGREEILLLAHGAGYVRASRRSRL